MPLWRAGTLGAVHAVGQPNPTRSHFAAMEAMENAAPGTSIRSGWLDRMLGRLLEEVRACAPPSGSR